MKKDFRLIHAMLAAAVIGAPAAYAGTVTYNVSGADTGTVTFTLSGTTITQVTGTFDGSTIATILAPGGIGGNDNSYYTTSPYLDDNGVSFQLATPDSDGFTFVNLYDQDDALGDGTIQSNVNNGSDPYDFNPDTLTPGGAPAGPTVPEPGTVGLTVVGAGMVFAMRRRSY